MFRKTDISSRFNKAMQLLDIRPGTTILVALSGGPDSTALLILLGEWG